MYAQLIELRSDPARLETVERLFRHDLVPALRERPGFSGALCLVNRERAVSLLVLLWETEAEAARPPARNAAPFGASSISVWEVDARC